MIAHGFKIPLSEVENRPITEYRLMLFTVINMASLNLGGDFKYQTPAEAVSEMKRQVKYFKGKGLLK